MVAATAAAPPPVVTLPDLSTIRERKGITLQQISQTTKISRFYLEAIERSDFACLPGGVFSRSYIRQYAKAIEYDEWDLLACYHARMDPLEPPPEEPVEHRILGFLPVPAPLQRWFAHAKRV
jgi:cytoskeleton protein RodZ